jgi:hypothetical protein
MMKDGKRITQEFSNNYTNKVDFFVNKVGETLQFMRLLTRFPPHSCMAENLNPICTEKSRLKKYL